MKFLKPIEKMSLDELGVLVTEIGKRVKSLAIGAIREEYLLNISENLRDSGDELRYEFNKH